LMPDYLMREAVVGRDLSRWAGITDLTEYCGVSKTAMKHRLVDLRLISIGPDNQLWAAAVRIRAALLARPVAADGAGSAGLAPATARSSGKRVAAGTRRRYARPVRARHGREIGDLRCRALIPTTVAVVQSTVAPRESESKRVDKG
jgi:hypothetical protein